MVGFVGLAPYFPETKAHLPVGGESDASAVIEIENEFLVTQRLMIEPFLEAELFAQDVPALEVGSGLSGAALGLQARYEFTRSFAPYVEIKHERKFGKTSSIAERHGESADTAIGTVGLRWMFWADAPPVAVTANFGCALSG